MAWVFDNVVKHPKFLDKNAADNVETMGCHVSINSFPRSGNSLVRKYTQNILGIVTGSDMLLDGVIT